MSLIFTEGFDSGTINAGHIASGKWHPSSSSSNGVSAVGRNGSYGFITSGQGPTWYRTFNSTEADDLVVVGHARTFSATGGFLVRLFGDCTSAAIGTEHVYFQYVYGAGSTGTIAAYRGAVGAGTLLGTSTAVVPSGRWVYLEFKVRLSATVGTVEVKMDGTSILTLTGLNTKNGGTATIFNGIGFLGSTSGTEFIDDIYVCNEQGSTNNDFLGDVRIECMTPNGDGNYSQFTPRPVNRLPNANVSGIETDASGWSSDTNVTVARVTTPTAGAHSTGALQVTVTATATARVKSATGTAGAPVLPGIFYTVWATLQAAVTRTPLVYIDWYDASGALLSRSGSSGVGAATTWPTGYAQKYTTTTLTAPTLAAFATVVIEIGSGSTAGEVYYIDDVAVVEGNQITHYTSPSEVGGLTTHYTTVNDLVRSTVAGRSDESYVVSQTDNQIDTWAHTNVSPAIPSGQSVKGVMAYAMARADTASAKKLALVTRLSSTDVTSGDTSLPQTYGGVSAAFETKPGGGAWTVADLNAAEFGVKIRP